MQALEKEKVAYKTASGVQGRSLKNKRQAVSQGARPFGKRSMPEACEHLQEVAQRRITA